MKIHHDHRELFVSADFSLSRYGVSRGAQPHGLLGKSKSTRDSRSLAGVCCILTLLKGSIIIMTIYLL